MSLFPAYLTDEPNPSTSNAEDEDWLENRSFPVQLQSSSAPQSPSSRQVIPTFCDIIIEKRALVYFRGPCENIVVPKNVYVYHLLVLCDNVLATKL